MHDEIRHKKFWLIVTEINRDCIHSRCKIWSFFFYPWR